MSEAERLAQGLEKHIYNDDKKAADLLRNQAAEIERLESEVVNTKQHLGLSHVALTLATQEANKYSYLREHHAKAILGSCFWFHATGDGQDDLDKLVSDAMGYTK